MTHTAGQRSLTEHLDWSIRLWKSGLRDTHIHVLGALIEALEITGGLAEGETTVQMSRWEIAQRTSLSVQQVQRVLAHLVSEGYLVRDQLAKEEGEVSRTLITEKALQALGMSGGATLDPNAPAVLVALLIGETKPVIDAVVSAWRDASSIPTSLGGDFRGGARRWSQIEFLLASRVEAHAQALAEASALAADAEEAEQAGRFPLTLASGEAVVLDAAPFRAAPAPAQRAVDLRFVRDTLLQLIARSPQMVTRLTLPKLVAELSFSRSAGFVFRHDAKAAQRILVSCVTRGTWSSPRGMDWTWKAVATRAVRAQGDRNCAA